ncbi:MAG: hypothetical protein J1E82_05415 [Muribaculaceae bacterium]|nr:hypothetical protein [Muribaculaceae bacterium]
MKISQSPIFNKIFSGRYRLIIFCPVFMLLISLFYACSHSEKGKSIDNLEDIYAEIDAEIEKSGDYQEEKQKRIDLLKSLLHRENDNLRKSEITDRLIEEYESFVSDSALGYINLNLENPVVKADRDKTIRLWIKKADIAAHAGLFGEAAAQLSEINSSELDSLLLRDYYSAYCDLYQYQIEYATDGEYAREAEILRTLYNDSVTSVSSPTDPVFVINKADDLIRENKAKEAEELLLNKIGEFKRGERNYSILASILAFIYKTTGQKDLYQHYLAESVISDIRGSIKENMAIRELATICYEEGDIERADRYLRQSFSDANYFSARMRNAQSSRMLPVIGGAYHQHQEQLTGKLRGLVISISILAAVLVLIIIFTILQFLKVKKVNSNNKRMLEEVSRLSEKLKSMNEEVTMANEQLKSSNLIKEEYAGLFMQYCSLAISHLQQYHQSLRVMAAQGNTKALLKKIDSTDLENKILDDFYDKFDEAILNIFPDFIDKFNTLLKPDYRFDIRSGESLNTELRIYALIRIGITDSEKIAKFLRCSLSTVYTYRSKTKKRAINPQSFEDEIRAIE